MRRSCYQMIGATAFLGAVPVAMFTNRPLGFFLFAGRGFLASQASATRKASLREFWDPAKRQRRVGGKRVVGVMERALLRRERRLGARNLGRLGTQDGIAARRRYATLETGLMAEKIGRVVRSAYGWRGM